MSSQKIHRLVVRRVVETNTFYMTLDGMELRGVRSYKITDGEGQTPILTLELEVGNLDIDVGGEIEDKG